MSDFKNTLDEYSSVLSGLENKYLQAEKDAVIAETNLKNLTKQRDEIILECETFTGMPFDKVSDLIKQKKEDLDGIMSRLSCINMNMINQDTLKELDAIIKDYGIT